MNHYVYEITNLVNGKKYIGKRSCKCNIEDDKYMGSGHKLKKAFEKYGKEKFSKKILVICNSSDEAYESENRLIEERTAVNRSDYYNVTSGGIGVGVGEGSPNYGKKLSEEHRKKLSIALKGRKSNLTDEARIKAWKLNTGKPRSEETRKKISMANKGRKHSEESLQKMSKALKGKKQTSEAVEARRKALTGRKLSKSHIENLSKSHINKFYDQVGVIQFEKNTKIEINRYNTIREASLLTGINHVNIRMNCDNKRPSAGGYSWGYIDKVYNNYKS